MKGKLKLMKALKVGPYTFTVTARNDDWLKIHNAYGMCDTKALTIDLVIEADPAIILDTLLHEITHAVWFVCNIHDDDNEERIVTTTATGFAGVFIDNPDLSKLIRRLILNNITTEE